MGFDREKFLAANKRLGEKGGGLSNFKEGIYICDLDDAYYGQAKSSGREQVTFVFKVNEPGEELTGKSIYNNIGLDSDGGYEAFNIALAQLGVKDIESFIADLDKNLKYLVGRTKVRLEVKHIPGKDNPNVEYQQIRIKRLIESAFSSENQQITQHQQVQQTQPVKETVKPTETVKEKPSAKKELTAGLVIGIQQKDGNMLQGKVINHLVPANKVFVVYDGPEEKKELVDDDKVFPLSDSSKSVSSSNAVETVEEVVDVMEEAIVIQEGMNVKFNWQGTARTGIVKQLMPEERKVKIHSLDTADGKTKAYPVSIDDVSVIK